MTFEELLSRLRQHHVNLWVRGDRLQYKGAQEVMTPELLDQIRKHKTDIILLLREADASTQPKFPTIRSDRRQKDNLPLSFAQEPLWFLHKLHPENASDHLYAGFRLVGQLDKAALQKSLNEIIRRHEILRTTFPVADGQPIQAIRPPLKLKISEMDLQDLAESAREREILRQVTEEVQKAFDFTHGPLLRAKLLCLGNDEHIFLLTMHHIISDGASFDLIYQELAQFYEAFVSGKSSPFEDLPVQYADYTCWQKQWMQGKTLESQISYWKQALRGSSQVLELPTDRPRPAVQCFQGAKRYIVLSKKIYKALKTLSQREGCTLFMTLVAAFQTLLYRYTGQGDLIVGVPVANRNRPELEKLIGLFLNMVILRTDLSGNPCFRSLLARVRKVTLEALGNQDLPFEKLVEELRPERDLSRNPLFQVMLELSPAGNLELSGLAVEPFEFDSGTAQFDLSLHLNEEDCLRGFFEYNNDLFDASSIDRMAGHFQTLLEGIIEDPDRRLSDLPLLTTEERHQLLVKWNDTAVNYPHQACLHQLFENQVALAPERVAAEFEEKQLTYAELNIRSNQLAHHLKKLGVGPEVLVGICVERSLEMLVALLAVLKSGGTYVPLDPSFPTERLSLMLEDAQVAVLLTQEDLLEILPETHGIIICLDKDWEMVAQEPQSDPTSKARANHLAYVIYTSGSTGKPKGVQIPHRAVVNFLLSMAKNPGLTEQDKLLAVTTLSFDIAVLELFLPLVIGACVVIASSEEVSDGDRLLNRLNDSDVTVMQATPASWRLLLAAGGKGSDNLKIFCGGEALPRDLATQLLETSHSLWNMYGPTETTVWSTVNRIDDKDGPVLIGFPIANTQVYILDQHLQPVPVGVPGELHIGGVGLARGYLNQPTLTDERFIANPFSDVPGSRLYKTGDLAKYLPDGNIEVLGRLDFQVKVRGFRIELGEIEATLEQHPSVQQTVVIVREDIPGDRQLVAYIVANNHQKPPVNTLRNFLKKKLPEYMVPALFEMMDALPLTPNGKVDRKALPPPSGLRPDLNLAYMAPGTEIEQTITGIWQEVLQIEKIGIEDNFFDLGGHSLRMAMVYSKLRGEIQKDLSMVELFQYPTISSLAKYLSHDEREPRASQSIEERADKLKEGKDRLKKRFNQRIRTDI